MKFTPELIIKFALFHAKRMRLGQQTDSEFYVKQSMEIFVKLNGDVDSFNFW
jgi:hypothetical protein